MSVMHTFSFYDRVTGAIHASVFSTNNPDMVKANTPPDHIAIDGSHDHLSQRFDLTTGQLVTYQPAAPSADHAWNAETKRWQLSAAAQEKIDQRQQALFTIAQLEAGQARTVREALLGSADALERLRVNDAQIAELRKTL
jgi:thiamine biosynthesis protein ThiC